MGGPTIREEPPTPCLKRAARLLGRPGHALADAELIDGCLAGVAEAWDALVERYHPLLYAVITRQGLGEAEAGDAFQDVCVLLMEHLPALRDRERLAGWLAATARRVAWRHQRQAGLRRGRESLTSELGEAGQSAVEVIASDAPGPEEDLLRLEERHLVHLGLARLAAPCRALLTLLYGDDAAPPYAEVAQRLKMPVGSVGPRRGRCLAALHEVLREFGF